MRYQKTDKGYLIRLPPGIDKKAYIGELLKSKSILTAELAEPDVLAVMKPNSMASPQVIFEQKFKRMKHYRPDGVLWAVSDLTKTDYYNLHPEFAPEKEWWYCKGEGFKKFYLKGFDYQDAKILARKQVGDVLIELGRDRLRHHNFYEDQGPEQPQSANDYQ